MPTLKDIVVALQRELDAAFAHSKAGSGGAGLEVEKATLSLAVDIQENTEAGGEPRLAFAILDQATAAKSSGHRLTIELRAPKPSPSEAAGSSEAAASKPVADPTIFETACQLFGQPGFDNAARAEVFCDAIKDLPETDARLVLESIAANSPLDENVPLDGARTRIRRLLRFSPVGEPAAAAALSKLARRFPVKEILQVVSSRWRMTTGWTPNEGFAADPSSN